MKMNYISMTISSICLAAVCSFAQSPADTLETTGAPGLSLKGEVLDSKMLGDVRNQLTGMIPGLEITESAGGLWNSGSYETFILNSEQIDVKYRGLGNLTCIVDGVLVPYSIYALDPSQIESITLVGDLVDRAKLGPMASNGALYIKTKRGGYNQPLRVKVNAEAGVAMTTVVPEWADGVDYALLNNQARANAGYTQQYSPLAIQGFLRGDAYDHKYPNVDYRSLMLGNLMPVGNASVSFTGGGDRVKYAASISELYSGDIIKTNETGDFNRINISSNVTTRVTDFLEVNAGFNSSISFRRAGRTSWNDWQNVPPVAYPVILGTQETDDEGVINIYGTTANWTENYYAKLAEGGFYTRRLRSAMIYANLGFDFDRWIKGLRSDTFVSYSDFMATTVTKSNDYLSYYWDAAAADGLGKISPDHQGVKSSGKSISSTGANQLLQLSEALSWNRVWGSHALKLGASFLMYDASMQSVGYYRRTMQAIGDLRYSFKDRYILEGVFQYAGSSRFNRDRRFKPFGSVGASWVVSNEDWLKDAGWIDKLKIRGQYGLVGAYSSAFGTQYQYQSDYAFSGSGDTYGPTLTLETWFGNKQWKSQKSTVTRLANPDLTWESVKIWEAGLDFDFCKGFSFVANIYGRTGLGAIEEVSSAVPSLYGLDGIDVYANYSSDRTFGYELALGYRHSWGDFSVNALVSAFHWNTVYDKLVSDDYLYDYQKKTGTSTNSIWGLQCIGKYETQQQLETIPSYSAAQIGDLMYKDQNGDGLVDTNDRVIIGTTQPKLRYSVNLGFKYRNFELQAVGTGRAGATISCTGDYFWSGWGDGNYSAFVRDNIGGAYPRLSYTKITNNFVASDFWLRDASWFKVQDVMLAYSVPFKNRDVLKGLTIQLKGQNLATLTRLEYIDPEATTSGLSVYPLFRTFTAGLKLNF